MPVETGIQFLTCFPTSVGTASGCRIKSGMTKNGAGAHDHALLRLRDEEENMESIRGGMRREGHIYQFIAKLLALFLIFEPFYLYSGLYDGKMRPDEAETRQVFDFLGGLLSPSRAEASPPIVMVPPHAPSDPLVPHETYSGATTILKGVARDVDNNLVGGSYYWDFGDGQQSATTPITASTDLENLSATHVYDQLAGTLIVARLYVKDAANESASKEYRILIKEKTLEVEVNKAIDDALWWLYTLKGTTAAGIVSSSSLRTPEGAPGLKGEYFNNPSNDYIFNFSGDPVLTRTDPEINFDWGGGSPGPGVNSSYFSVRWTGQIYISKEDFYFFYTVSDDGVRLFIDGNQLINDTGIHGSTWNRSAKIYLTQGWHAIQFEYFQAWGGNIVRFYWGGYYWNNIKYGDHYGNTTGSAVQAFEINGHLETGDPSLDPYATIVRGAMDYLLANLSSINISSQAGGNPDTNGNGIGLYWPSNRPIYETGAVMDAFVASGTPDAIAMTGGMNVLGRTYKDIVQDMVDFYIWAQSDQSDGGAWQYGINDGGRDNSASQWAAIGMIAAERHFGCTVPQWVKDRNNGWLNLSFNVNRFGYTGKGCNDACWATTPSGMVQMAFDGKDTSDPRWIAAEHWFADNWTTFLGWNRGNQSQTRDNRYYSYYAFTKAMRLALPQEITFITKTDGTQIEWYGDPVNGLARLLLDTQKADGSWPYDGWPYVGEQTAAAWCVIILGRSLFEKPPVAVATASPNPAGVGTVITFDASHSYHLDPAKEIVQYLWDFDASDGVDFDHPDATGPVVTNAYGALQDYVVTLKIVDNSTPPRYSTTQITVHISVPPHPPTAVTGGPYLAAVGEPVQVDGSGSYDIDEGMSQPGCDPPCPPDTVTAWDWESKMVAPYQFLDASGKIATLPPFTAPGFYDIALRATDNTALAFPASGKPNLTDIAYGKVYVFPGGIENLRVRPKETKCELLWTPYPGALVYDVLRSEKGPNEGFEFIGQTSSIYSVYIDYHIQRGKDYWYKVMTSVANEWIISGVVYTRPGGQGDVNRPPVITSQPVTTGQVNALYSYQVQAVDPEGQTLTYFLDQAPIGMAINPSTGLMTWTPGNDQLGMNDVTVRVQDPGHVSVSQSFSIFVRTKTNNPPVALPGGPYLAQLGQSITFNGSGSSDPDGDKIVTYRWLFGDGTEATGVEVTHTYITGGTFVVKLYVTDERGGTGSASTTATVNRPPVAVPGASYQGTVNVPVNFDGSRSYDLDGDVLTYGWDFGDGSTGSGALVAHTYTAVGHYTVTLTVSDGRGGVSSQSTLANIQEEHVNEAPVASFEVSGNLIACGTVIFDASGSYDPDGTIASYVWGFGDGGSTTGRLVSHVYGTPGDYTVTLTVTDDGGVSIPTNKVVSIGANHSPVAVPGGPYRGKPSASITFNGSDSTDPDGDAIVNYHWTFGDGGSADGVQVTHSYNATGDYTVTLTVTDACGKQGSADTTAQIVDDVIPPEVAIITPADGSEITQPTDIIGTAKDANFDFYVLEYAPSGSGTFIEFGQGTSSVDNGVLGRFDPTLLLNGIYTIRLTAADYYGNSATTQVSYTVKGALKVGNFSISFIDLSVPLGGISMTVRRTYDSRDKAKGDFGIGWRMDVQTIRIEKSQSEGLNWSQERSGWTYYLQALGEHNVTVVLPNGAVQAFEFTPTPWYQSFVPLAATRAAYTPKPGTFSTLEPVGDRDLLVGDDGVLYDYNGNPYDPHLYKMTLSTGAYMILDAQSGLKSITDPNGNTLTIDLMGFSHSSGSRVDFIRDGEDRIVTIIDPVGHQIQYQYDNAGDLAAVVDQEGRRTTFTYDVNHYLLEIQDPLGRNIVRNIYDDQGRLVAQIDSQGNQVTYNHDIDSRQEVVFNNKGNATVFEYNDQGKITAVTDALGATATYTYDAQGKMLTATTTSGETTVFAYDGNGNLNRLIDPAGNAYDLTYDSRGFVTSVKDPKGNTETYAYDEKGNLLAIQDSSGNTTSRSYDTAGNLTKITDPTGREVHLEYDSYGRLTKRIDFSGTTHTNQYDANGNVVVMTKQTGSDTLVTQLAYNGLSQVVQIATSTGAVRDIEYDELGRLKTETDEWGKTEYEYDLAGRIKKVKYPDGSEESKEYDPDGLLLSKTDGLGRKTTYTYDKAGNLTKTVFPDGSTQIIIRNASGREVSRTDQRGYTTSYEYDSIGRVSAVIDPLGNRTTFTYDANDNLETTTTAGGAITRFVYDEWNRRIQTINPDGTVYQVAYDILGQRTSEIDPAGITTRFEYAGKGQLTKVVDALGGETLFSYDGAGNLISLINPRGHQTLNEYNAFRQLTKRTLPTGVSELFTYNPKGQMLTKMDFKGNITSFKYDGRGSVAEKTYPDASKVIFSYHPTGKLASMTDALGTTQYEYDIMDRLTKVTYPNGKEISYAYDLAGNLSSMTADGNTTSYAYDGLNRLTEVTDPEGKVTQYTYSYDRKDPDTVSYPNGSVTSFQYDTMGRLIYVETKDSSDTLLSSYAYSLGPAGERLKVVEHTGRTVEYTYDALYRLTGEKIHDPILGDGELAYSYDGAGNRITKTDALGSSVTYTYDGNNRLLTEGSIAYGYDNNGNLISRTSGGKTDLYEYDYENRLIRFTPGGGTPISYTYDGKGNLVKVTDGLFVTNYLVDTNNRSGFPQILLETDAGGNTIATYVFGNRLISMDRAGALSFFHYDGRNSTRQLADITGTITDHYTYDAFGSLLASTGVTVNPHLFNGERFDADLGAYYLRARHYVPAIGRFLTADSVPGSLRLPQSLNLYTYTQNDPVNKSDPSGHQTLGDVMIANSIRNTLAQVQCNVGFEAISMADGVRMGHSWEQIYDSWKWGQFINIGLVGLPLIIAPLSKAVSSLRNWILDVAGELRDPIYGAQISKWDMLPANIAGNARHKQLVNAIAGMEGHDAGKDFLFLLYTAQKEMDDVAKYWVDVHRRYHLHHSAPDYVAFEHIVDILESRVSMGRADFFARPRQSIMQLERELASGEMVQSFKNSLPSWSEDSIRQMCRDGLDGLWKYSDVLERRTIWTPLENVDLTGLYSPSYIRNFSVLLYGERWQADHSNDTLVQNPIYPPTPQ